MVLLGRDLDSHMVNLSDVVRQFEQYGMKLKPKKMSTSSDFGGILVSREGVHVPPGEITRRGACSSWGDYSNW